MTPPRYQTGIHRFRARRHVAESIPDRIARHKRDAHFRATALDWFISRLGLDAEKASPPATACAGVDRG